MLNSISTFRIGRHEAIALLLILVLFSLSACAELRPNARVLHQVPQDAPALYQQGWKDGCESGMAITGNDVYKAVYQNRIDPQLVQNPLYFQAWNEAKVYCAHYTMATQWEGKVLPKTPTEDRTLLPEPQGVFAVVASLGTPTLFPMHQEEPEEERGLFF